MSRSPLAYPLSRSADMDAGGAADLQTDIMRFMAILSLCLVAIFALVQSIPLTPAEPIPEQAVVVEPDKVVAKPEPVVQEPVAAPNPPPVETTEPVKDTTDSVVLTRPKWVPKYTPAKPDPVASKPAATEPAPVASEPAPTEPVPVVSEPAVVEPEDDGFTLRFASDAALTRAVAASKVGLYALEPGRAKRMTVSESRISFWDASTPNTFHEMEAHTVPAAVMDALARTGVTTDSVAWGVTLPGQMTSQLESLMQEHRGGSLIIGASGDIHWEAS